GRNLLQVAPLVVQAIGTIGLRQRLAIPPQHHRGNRWIDEPQQQHLQHAERRQQQRQPQQPAPAPARPGRRRLRLVVILPCPHYWLTLLSLGCRHIIRQPTPYAYRADDRPE